MPAGRTGTCTRSLIRLGHRSVSGIEMPYIERAPARHPKRSFGWTAAAAEEQHVPVVGHVLHRAEQLRLELGHQHRVVLEDEHRVVAPSPHGCQHLRWLR